MRYTTGLIWEYHTCRNTTIYRTKSTLFPLQEQTHFHSPNMAHLDDILAEIVAQAPPGELGEVAADLSVVVPGLSGRSVQNYTNTNWGVFSSSYVASGLNKDKNLAKYVDHVRRELFNVDVAKGTAIDVEKWTPDVVYPEFYDKLVDSLRDYGADHFPLSFAFTVIPDDGKLDILLIGERVNADNFFTGRWKAHYAVESGAVSGAVSVDIHSYEDGNVRLNYDEKVGDKVDAGASPIVNFIARTEHAVTLKIVDDFSELNNRYFKNLRRVLPVTKSKVNWGSAIGNYRLGADVVNKK